MMLCYSKTRKIKKLFGPPPPLPKKAHRYERSRYVYTHKCLSIPAARDMDIHYRSGFSIVSDSDYKVILSLKIVI